jgi:hypothetical protein
MGWNPSVSRIGEIAVDGAPHETAVARRIEPPRSFGVGDYRLQWLLGFLMSPAPAAMAAMPPAVTLMLLLAIPALGHFRSWCLAVYFSAGSTITAIVTRARFSQRRLWCFSWARRSTSCRLGGSALLQLVGAGVLAIFHCAFLHCEFSWSLTVGTGFRGSIAGTRPKRTAAMAARASTFVHD